MLLCLESLLTSPELECCQTLLASTPFIDGKVTAGWHAKLVKNNEQLVKGDSATALTEIIVSALERHPLVQAAARPKFIHSVLFSRYQAGMGYGRHVDNALMGGKQFYRSDLSFTVFLNDPDAYDGGELVIESVNDETSYKLPAGQAILYPSTSLHWVNPVINGDRLVAVGWIQSLIRDSQQREILFELETVKRSLFAQAGKSNEFDIVSKSVANLLRMWAE